MAIHSWRQALIVAGAVAVVVGLFAGGLGSRWLILCLFACLAALALAARVASTVWRHAIAGEKHGSDQRRFGVHVTLFAAFFSLLMAVLIPPLQSPDEMAHLARAYSLLQEEVVLQRLGERENLRIERGLKAFGNIWGSTLPFKPDVQVTREMEQRSRDIRWSGDEIAEYNPAGIYFPTLYAPASAGLGLARYLDQPPWVMAMWARIGMWFVSIAALGMALMIVQAGFRLMCATALLPMSLAQIGSSNLDSLTITGSFLLIALFTWLHSQASRSVSEDVRTCAWASSWLLLALLALAKPVFLTMLAMPFFWSLRNRNWKALLPGIAILALVLVWQYHVSAVFSNPNPAVTGSPIARLIETILSPIEAVSLLIRTFQAKADFYWHSMVGILGWLDTPLLPGTYWFAGWLLALALLSDILAAPRPGPSARLSIAVTGVAYVVGSMLLLWVTWTPLGNPVIEGVQGRYFLPLLPALGVVLCGIPARQHWVFHGIQRVVTVFFFVYMAVLVVDIPTALIDRYWL